jgi:fermentation-respiration switch protein FrsA (DUF1100 family)
MGVPWHRVFPAALLAVAFSARAMSAQGSATDEWLKKPVDDATYHGFLQFFTYDHSLPFDVRSMESDDVEGVRREHLSFQSNSGQRVTARIYNATGTTGGSHGWVVLLHGANALGKDGAGAKFSAGFLARAGWNVLSLDMLYYGERKTDLVTEFTSSDLIAHLYSQPSTYLAWVAQTVKDAGRAYDFLVKKHSADSKHIALLGESRGAVASAIIGGADHRFAAVMLLYAGHHLAAETVGHLPAACPANYIGRIAPRPLLMLNGMTDKVFVRDSTVLPLQRLAREPKRIIWVETGHVQSLATDLPQVASWLRETVK